MQGWKGATHVGNFETSVRYMGRPPVIHVGGWMLDDNESRMLHGQHIHAVEVEVMVKTFWNCIPFTGLEFNSNKMKLEK